MNQNLTYNRFQNQPDGVIAKSKSRLLNRKEVASLLGISVSSLRRWEKAGRIEKHRLTCRTIRFDPQEIDKIIRENKIGRFN